MKNVHHTETEVVHQEPEETTVVTTTDPVTGQEVRVDRASGEVVPDSEVTQTTYRRVDADPALREQYVSHVAEDPYARRRTQVARLVDAIYLIFGVIEALIAMRFVLRLLAANPQAGFASFIYGITSPFIAPFVGLFGTPSYNGSVLELHSIVAIIIYALIAWLLARVVWLAAGEERRGWRSTEERIDRHIR